MPKTLAVTSRWSACRSYSQGARANRRIAPIFPRACKPTLVTKDVRPCWPKVIVAEFAPRSQNWSSRISR
jgi:hypothetical protein